MIPESETQRAHPGGPQEGQGKGLGFGKWLCLSLVLCAAAVAFVFWVRSYGHQVSPVQQERVVNIPAGSSFRSIKKTLIAQQIIANDFRFDLLVKMNGAASRLKAGEYLFAPGLSHNEIIAKLVKGDVAYRSLTIPEGANIFQIGELLARQFSFDFDAFMQLIRDPEFVSSFGLHVPSLEGYLFPETYFVARHQSLEQVVGMMVRRFQKVYAEIPPPEESVTAIIQTTHQVVILASIVEKETAVADERPLVAAVFLNRLKKKMKLQADPTVIYGIDDFNGNLTRKDLQTPSPYNTYTARGLPAGPIANPGKEALQAVLHPAGVDSLYFVAKKDGTHHFSRTLREHNRAVRLFQKAGKASTRTK
ncbi:MAG: endolytic transglycosylase MltG [Desulfobulbaceae bacterium]|nr:endolytic transglycosylase MltG [Desulfobulbaceae bacterium]